MGKLGLMLPNRVQARRKQVRESPKQEKAPTVHSNSVHPPSVPEGFAARVAKVVAERGSNYGHPADNHQLTANLWSQWLSRRLGQDVVLTAEDVCMLNVLQKCSRLANGTHDDSWYDIGGYTENVAMIRPDQRNRK